jgi:hypothetical protein
MNKKFSLLLAAGALAAFLVNPLIAGKQKSGPMVIPINGTEDGETWYNEPTYLFDDEENLIGFRDLQIGVTTHLNIPMLGIEDWALPGYGFLDLDFHDGDPYLLKFKASGGGLFDEGEIIAEGSTFGFHRMTSETMTEKYITSTRVFVSGPLEGVVMTTVAHAIEPLVDPPDYVATFTGYLFVPAHVKLEDLKNHGRSFGSLNKL